MMPGALDALRRHWPEYLIEAWGLGTFMVAAGLFATLLEYPGSPVHRALPDPFVRRALMGAAMGLTAVAIIYSPWGKRSGAHINPAVTLTFLRLGKVKPVDALFYVLAQFAGGALGVLLVLALLGAAFGDPPVAAVQTVPGPAGPGVAFAVEAAMAFGLMLMVVVLLHSERWMTRIGLFAGLTVACYIALLAPLSGMSINPARSFASAAPSGAFGFLWLYLTAPVIGMLLAAEAYRLTRGAATFKSPKLCPNTDTRCIFTGFDPRRPAGASASPAPEPARRATAAERN